MVKSFHYLSNVDRVDKQVIRAPESGYEESQNVGM